MTPDHQQDLFASYGTEPSKLVRAQGPDTSMEAAERVDSNRLERMVHGAIARFGIAGCISDEVRAQFPIYPYSSITARYAALIEKGFIEDTGLRRPGLSGRGQRIMRSLRPPA